MKNKDIDLDRKICAFHSDHTPVIPLHLRLHVPLLGDQQGSLSTNWVPRRLGWSSLKRLLKKWHHFVINEQQVIKLLTPVHTVTRGTYAWHKCQRDHPNRTTQESRWLSGLILEASDRGVSTWMPWCSNELMILDAVKMSQLVWRLSVFDTMTGEK